MPRSTLLARFSIASLILLAVIGLSLGWAITRYLEYQSIEHQKTALSSLVPPVVGPYITSDLMSDGAIDPGVYSAIESALSYLGGANLVRVKIWSPSGMIAYSDERPLVGRIFPVEEDLQEALNGETVADISQLQGAENVAERGYGELLEVYTPLYDPATSHVLGVFEGYYDVDELRSTEHATQGYLWSSIGVGFLFLYITLFTIVRNASLRLTRQSEENAQLYHEAQAQLAHRIQAEHNIQRQLDRLGALRSIDISITSSLDLRLTLQVILDHVRDQLQVDAADVLLLTSSKAEITRSSILSLPHCALQYIAGIGFRHNAIAQSHVLLGEGYAGRAALQRRTLHIPNISNTDNLSRASLFVGEDFVSYYAVPLIAKDTVRGVLEIFHRAPLEPNTEWLGFLEALAGQTAIAIENSTLFDDLQHSNIELASAYDNTLEGWSRALDLRDKETEGHTRRVTEMTVKLARSMGVSEPEILQIRRGALLHDIGKMGIPDAILLKPGPLTSEEWVTMRMHPTYAYHLLSPISFLHSALDIPYCHHEKWDGTGYPRGLKGEEIPLAARIFAIVDVWDALRSDRPYRSARSRAMVYAYLREQSGKHFDPQVVSAFLADEFQRSIAIQSPPHAYHSTTTLNTSSYLTLQNTTEAELPQPLPGRSTSPLHLTLANPTSPRTTETLVYETSAAKNRK